MKPEDATFFKSFPPAKIPLLLIRHAAIFYEEKKGVVLWKPLFLISVSVLKD